MHKYYPLLLVGGILGAVSIVLIIAYASIKDKKQAIGFDRHMKDSVIIKRLLRYAKPYVGSFILVGFIMLVGIGAYLLAMSLVLPTQSDIGPSIASYYQVNGVILTTIGVLGFVKLNTDLSWWIIIAIFLAVIAVLLIVKVLVHHD